MAIGMMRAVNTDLARLEAAAASAGYALVCSHQSAEEFHRALIRDYLKVHAPKRAGFYLLVVGIIAVVFICF